MFTRWSANTWVVDTGGVRDTLFVGAFFMFIAYVLQPSITSVFQKARAYHAWRSIEESKTVDITNYSMVKRIFGRRGKWDIARTVAVLSGLASLSCWGLEVSVNPALCTGHADPLHRPPPVDLIVRDGIDSWQVKTRDDLHGYGVSNVFDSFALSRYYLTDGIRPNKFVNGGIIAAFWSAEERQAPAVLYYASGERGVAATVERIECAGGQNAESVDVYNGDVRWGAVETCENGPTLMPEQPELYVYESSPSAIILRRDDGEVFIIVQENSSYPKFLYSVWIVESHDGDLFQLNHLFHIAATMQLAEAVVTGVVHGEISGRGCFSLLRMFSESRNPYLAEDLRACPFGEHPSGFDIVRLEYLDMVECGLEGNANTLVCILCLAILTLVGVGLSLYVRANVGIDVYTRDGIIRALSLNEENKDKTPLSTRSTLFVHKDSAGNIVVVVGDSRNVKGDCTRALRCGKKVTNNLDRVETTVDQSNIVFDGAPDPVHVRSRVVWPDEARTGKGRALPGPNGNFCYPSSSL